MTATTTKLSVITPTRNRLAFLKRCVVSVLGQLGPDDEWVVQAAPSGDGTSAWLVKLSAYDRRVKAVSQPDAGEYDAINKATARATGDAFCWLPDDDELAPGAVEVVRRWLDEHPGVDVGAGGTLVRYDRTDGVVIDMAPLSDDLHWGRAVTHGDGICSPSMWVRRAAWQRVGPFCLDLVCGDTDWRCRAFKAGLACERIPAPTVVYHWHQKNLTFTVGRRAAQDVIRLAMRHGTEDDVALMIRLAGPAAIGMVADPWGLQQRLAALDRQPRKIP